MIVLVEGFQYNMKRLRIDMQPWRSQFDNRIDKKYAEMTDDRGNYSFETVK